jgi:DNA-binding NtrC family response regulator
MSAAEVLLVVTDESLRAVLEIALSMDGYRVRTAITAQDALDALATMRPDVLILDIQITPGSDPVRWAGRHAADTPLILIVPAWDDVPPPSHPNVVTLTMPFGREDLRRALAGCTPPRARPPVADSPPPA